MNKRVISSLIVLFFMGLSFIGCNLKGDNLKNNVKLEKESDGVIYNNLEKMSFSEFKVLDSFSCDINDDNKLEEIKLYGKGEIYQLLEGYIAIENKDSQEVLTYFEVPSMAVGVGSIGDITGDGKLDILVDLEAGGNAGGGCNIYIYENGMYRKGKVVYSDLKYYFENDYKYKVIDTQTGLEFSVDIKSENLSRYKENKVFDENGNVITPNIGEWRNTIGGEIVNYNNENSKKIVLYSYITSLNGRVPITSIEEIYQFSNGQFKLVELKGEAAVIPKMTKNTN